MNYGKLAYLKVNDLEKQLQQNGSDTINPNVDCFEITESESIEISSTYTHKFATITTSNTSDCCIFLNLNITSTTAQSVTISLKFDGVVICSQTKSLNAQNNEINISSVASSVAKGQGDLEMTISSEGQITLNNFNLVVIGASINSNKLSVELKACEFGSLIAVSYIKDNKIYYHQTSTDNINLASAQFVEFKQAQAHSVCFDLYNDEDKSLTFLYVGTDGNLYLARVGDNQEMFVDSSVSSVCVGNNPEEGSMVIVYVKDGKVLYKTLKQNVLSQSSVLNLPQADFINVRTVASEGNKSYVIATDKDYNNYICSSVGAPNVSKLLENIKFGLNILLSTYIYKERYPVEEINNISCTLAVVATATRYAKAQYNFTDITDLLVECNFRVECFTIPENGIVYGVDYDPSSENAADGVLNCVYVEDCTGFTPASITYDSSTMTAPVYADGSWVDKWPYNAIKPCLFKSENEITYLCQTDLTKSEDLTQENLDIESGNSGDVMVEIPKIYYRIHENENGVLQFRISNHKRFGYECFAFYYKGQIAQKLYVGAYPSTLKNDLFYSLSNNEKYRVQGKTVSQLQAFTTPRGTNFAMTNLNVSLLLQLLFIIQFKSIDYRSSIGYGYSFVAPTGERTTGLSNSYPTRTYGYLKTTQRSVERFLNIEGFASFGHYCLEGTYPGENFIGCMDVEGFHNNWVDETNHKDYLNFYSAIPNGNFETLKHSVNTYTGLIPTQIGTSVVVVDGFDFFRSRITRLGETYYRMHYPCQGIGMLGVFSYIINDLYTTSAVQGHRLVYFKI